MGKTKKKYKIEFTLNQFGSTFVYLAQSFLCVFMIILSTLLVIVQEWTAFSILFGLGIFGYFYTTNEYTKRSNQEDD